MGNEYLKRLNQLNSNFNGIVSKLDAGIKETDRVLHIIQNTPQILDDLDKKYAEQTQLNNTDILLLSLATGLQIARQYFVLHDKTRITDKEGDKNMEDFLSVAPPHWSEVLTQSVPYDAIKTSSHVNNTGLGGTTHRARTLGHDPVLGWIFGTANILTNSLTTNDFETYQVKNMTIVRHYPNGSVNMLNNAMNYAYNDPKLLAVSIARQAIHFGSDYYTKQGLPVPFISTVNDELALKMISKWKFDMFSITRSASLACFINFLISVIHQLFYTGQTDMDQKIYEVKTRKILKYSNVAASSSNLAVVAVTKDLSKLDIGGLAVTLYRLITDTMFINSLREEFVFGTYLSMIDHE